MCGGGDLFFLFCLERCSGFRIAGFTTSPGLKKLDGLTRSDRLTRLIQEFNVTILILGGRSRGRPEEPARS
jgi:hypothetical protein